MARFRYQRGDRPLEGFTIEYGLGVGGFGEVYYAVSDSGREVALKAVQHFEEIELRGIRHCMNLKSPHLVTVFDVRHNERQDPFVVMEYVHGPSLRTLLDESPEGIGPTKAAFFLREMAKGLSYLHDAGVVHRALKPHNVFYEEGFVKIGDYSLCKLISTTHHTGHTMTVGTVHYMAPEVSRGRYDSSVDIYALGVMVYEMLTGQPPFTGDSIGEVLMKHMTEEPDLSRIEEPFRSAIGRALAKEPEQRFATAEEMVAAIFGTEHVQNSVVAFNPQELTLVADHAAQKVAASAGSTGAGSGRPQPWRAQPVPPPTPTPAPVMAIARPATQPRAWEVDRRPAPDWVGWRPLMEGKLAKDAMPLPIRVALGAAAALGLCLFTASATWHHPYLGYTGELFAWMLCMVATALVCFAILRVQVLRNLAPDSRLVPMLLVDLMLTFAVLPLGLAIVPLLIGLDADRIFHGGAVPLLLALVPLGLVNWQRTTHPLRQQRLHFTQLFTVTGISFLLGLFAYRIGNHYETLLLLSPTITAAIAIGWQIMSPVRRPLPATQPSSPVGAPAMASVPGGSGHAVTVARDSGRVESAQPFTAQAVRKREPVPADASPFARWPLVALCGVFFVLPIFGGLHRFYVGKRSSGFIWIFTLGLGGLGQIYDLVKILRGEFEDAEGRRVLAWEASQAPSTPVNKLSSVPPESHAATAMQNVIGALGNVMFTGSAVLAGIALTTKLASAEYGMVDREISMAMSVIGFGLLVGSIGLVIHARRHDGPWVLGRTAFSAMLLGLTLAMASLSNFVPMLVIWIFLLPTAMMLFAWPSKASREDGSRAAAEQEVLV